MYAQLSEFHGVVAFDLEDGRIVRRRELPIDDGVTEDDYDFEAPHHGLAITPDERTLCAAGRASDYVALLRTRRLRPIADHRGGRRSRLGRDQPARHAAASSRTRVPTRCR